MTTTRLGLSCRRCGDNAGSFIPTTVRGVITVDCEPCFDAWQTMDNIEHLAEDITHRICEAIGADAMTVLRLWQQLPTDAARATVLDVLTALAGDR